MENKITLNRNDNSILSISLLEILSQINNGFEYEWKLLYLEATTEMDLDILDLEEKINNSESGYLISWNDLTSFSNQVFQIIQILLIGGKHSQNLKRFISDDEMRLNCDFCIELVDSSYWEISCKDEEILKRIKILETPFAPNPQQ